MFDFTLHFPQAIIMDCLKKTSSISESTVYKKLDAFQKALYRHEVASPDIKIYNPGTMKQFVDKYSPALFQDLFSCITGGKSLSSKRRELQEQRVVSLLHILAYFR